MPQLLVEVELVEKIEEPPDVAEEEERTHLKAEEDLCPLVSTPRWKIGSLSKAMVTQQTSEMNSIGFRILKSLPYAHMVNG